MPIVRAELPYGMTDGQKPALRQAVKGAVISALAPKPTRYIYVGLREAFHATAGIDRQDLYLPFRETETENHDCGGQPLPNWVPADG